MSTYLRKECIQTGLQVKKKEDVLKTIVSVAKRNTLLDNYSEDVLFEKFSEREKVASTGFSRGVAMPHCILENLEEFVIGVVTVPSGVGFDAMDGKATKVFIFIIAPDSKRNEHIKLLSTISKYFRSDEDVEEIVSLNDADSVYKRLEHIGRIKKEIPLPKEYCMMQVYLQNEEKLNEIVRIFSETDNCTISVSDGYNASHFLHALPLFASFWSHEHNKTHKIITAVLNKSLCNETLRKINVANEASGQDNKEAMITVNDLIFQEGYLDL